MVTTGMRKTRMTTAVAATTLIAGAAFAGTASASPAAPTPSSATSAVTYCGSACNGRSPSYVFNGSSCASDSRRVNGPYYPRSSSGLVDKYMQLYLRYSPHCQTIWPEAVNLKPIGRTSCSLFTIRSLTPTAGAGPTLCDTAGGGSGYGAMIDDHCSTACVAGYALLDEAWNGTTLRATTAGY